MSSPYIRPHGDYPDRRVASSPPLMTLNAPEPQEPSIRPMRLKVLYTFDNENKTNCLARWPQIVNIQTFRVDETGTQVGIIQLKTCVEAIIEASPEIIAKLGQDDYTVYAYDYSEYETPLVGQGMLSRALAVASSSPAPAHQSDKPVTGRVCKNILGLFGNGVQETLEVKLRLVPVPSCLQREYIESMRRYYELSSILPEAYQAQAWGDHAKPMSDSRPVQNQSRSQSPATPMEPSQHGMERLQQLMSTGYDPQDARRVPTHSRHGSFSTTILSGQETIRLGSPTPSSQSMGTLQPANAPYTQYSCTASRASDRGAYVRPRKSSIVSAVDAGYVSNEDRHEEGPIRKRAKVTKADHPGKTSLGKKVGSLRVTASTAASIRVFQPTAVRPFASSNASVEMPPRAPTPVPQDDVQRRRPLLPASRSSLGVSLTTSDSGYRSLNPDSDALSPEKTQSARATNSPEDLASSPPVMRDVSAAPSSPVLPALPHHTDFDFTDDTMGRLLDDARDIDLPAVPHDHRTCSQQFHGTTQDLGLLRVESRVSEEPIFMGREREEEEARATEVSRRNARRAIGIKRSQTWSGTQPSSDPPHLPRRSSAARSDSVAPKSRSGWDKEKRKKAIQSKLNSSIKAGEMPPFCENCGAIETPTWRKAFSRLHSGDHSQVQLGGEDGAVVAIQIVESNEDGSTKLFRIFKKTRTAAEEEAGFNEVLLCNPCGIWLSNRRCMRPPNLWNGKDSKSKSESAKEKPRKSRAKRKADAATAASDFMDAPSEALTLASDASTAPFAFHSQSDDGSRSTMIQDANDTDVEAPQLSSTSKTQSTHARVERKEARDSDEPEINPSAIVALQRAIQSSPGHRSFLGSAQSPIEVDKKSPDPARRSLFPSPKTSGPLGVSAPSRLNWPQKPPKTPNDVHREAEASNDQADKENLPPRSSTPDDGLDDLFSGFSPKTPSRRADDLSKSPSSLFKTPGAQNTPTQPSLTTGDFFSSAVKAFLHAPRTPTRTPTKRNARHGTDLTPFTAHMNHLLSGNLMTSPSHLLSEVDHLPLPLVGRETDNQPSIVDGGTPSRMFRTADFDFGAFASSDMPMPSSPPAWFGVYEDPMEEAADWDVGSDVEHRDEAAKPTSQHAERLDALEWPRATAKSGAGQAKVDAVEA